MRRTFVLSVFFLTLSAVAGGLPAGAQQGITGTVTINRPDTIQDQGFGGFMASSNGGMIHNGILSGKVTVEGDPLLWQPLKVFVTCSDSRYNMEVEADFHGNYAITKLNLPKVDTLAGDQVNQLEQYYEGCAVTSPLAGYESKAVTITQKNLRDNPHLAAIVLRVDEHAPGTDVSSTTGAAPAEARKAFEQAHDAWMRRDVAGTQRGLEETVKLDPQFAEAWYLLGRIEMGQNLEEGKASLRKAHEADPRYVPACTWLAAAALQERNWAEAAQWAGQALALDPAGTARIWYYNAQADYRMGRNEAARMSALKAMAMDPKHTMPTAEELLALTLADKGDYSGALEHLRNNLTYIDAGPNAELIKRQIAFLEQQSAAKK